MCRLNHLSAGISGNISFLALFLVLFISSQKETTTGQDGTVPPPADAVPTAAFDINSIKVLMEGLQRLAIIQNGVFKCA